MTEMTHQTMIVLGVLALAGAFLTTQWRPDFATRENINGRWTLVTLFLVAAVLLFLAAGGIL